MGSLQNDQDKILVCIKGAGDIASGIALRLFHAGFRVVMTDLPHPTAIRRTVCFSEAVRLGRASVEDVTAVFASCPEEALEIAREGMIPVIADEKGDCIRILQPTVLIDAILAKKNLGTAISDAPAVIAVGPGFTAGTDCHAVVETMRGHTLGRVLYSGSALPNTGKPGNIAGFTSERLLRSPCAGIFRTEHEIGDLVEKDETVATVDGMPVKAGVAGKIRGLLPDGTPVPAGMKSGDVDPRGESVNEYLVSDKALSVGGGVLEAIMHFLYCRRTGRTDEA